MIICQRPRRCSASRLKRRLLPGRTLAYRWFCKLGIEDAIPDHSAFSRARNERFREGDVFRRVFERVVEACIAMDRSSLPTAPSRSPWP
jgi:transposase